MSWLFGGVGEAQRYVPTSSGRAVAYEQVYPPRRSAGPRAEVRQEGFSASGNGVQGNETRKQRNERRQLGTLTQLE